MIFPLVSGAEWFLPVLAVLLVVFAWRFIVRIVLG